MAVSHSNGGRSYVTNQALSNIMAGDSITKEVSIVSFNMHGFNQGIHTVRDMSLCSSYDVFLLQEHWLTPFNLSKFNDSLPEYTCFGSSAMASDVESGVLRGRPYGGVMTLVSNKLHNCTHFVCSDDRYIIIMIGNLMIVNVYLPCVGVANRSLICEDVLENIATWIEKYPDRAVIFGGDLNADLNDNNAISKLLNQFAAANGLSRCDSLLPGGHYSTYYNDSLKCHSTIDFFLTSNESIVSAYNVIDPVLNLSDHRPVVICCDCLVGLSVYPSAINSHHNANNQKISYLRWDHANFSMTVYRKYVS